MKKVFVYWNFNKKLWSIRSLDTGKVIKRLPELCLVDCVFKVSQSGRNRVLKEKRKNVHAGVIGIIVKNKYRPKIPISYNPYKYKTFVDRNTLKPIEKAKIVCFKQNGICMMK